MKKINIDQIPDIEKRSDFMWGGNFYPHHIDQGYWPTSQEFSILQYILSSKERIDNLKKNLGKSNFRRTLLRCYKKPLYEWLNENFLSYCENYEVPITKDLFHKALLKFDNEVAIPWLDSEENKNSTYEELKEKYWNN